MPICRVSTCTPQLIGAQLLTGLEMLHREGYIHRDVKPANFALSPPRRVQAMDADDACYHLLSHCRSLALLPYS